MGTRPTPRRHLCRPTKQARGYAPYGARTLAERRAGSPQAPAHKWRAMGRIEHTLLDEGRKSSPTDLRPSPANPPYHKKCQMFLSTPKGRDPDKEPGPIGAKARPEPREGIYSPGRAAIESNLTLRPLNVVNRR